MPLHGAAAKRSLEAAGYEVLEQPLPSGEEHKTLATVSGLYDGLVACAWSAKARSLLWAAA